MGKPLDYDTAMVALVLGTSCVVLLAVFVFIGIVRFKVARERLEAAEREIARLRYVKGDLVRRVTALEQGRYLHSDGLIARSRYGQN